MPDFARRHQSGRQMGLMLSAMILATAAGCSNIYSIKSRYDSGEWKLCGVSVLRIVHDVQSTKNSQGSVGSRRVLLCIDDSMPVAEVDVKVSRELEVYQDTNAEGHPIIEFCVCEVRTNSDCSRIWIVHVPEKRVIVSYDRSSGALTPYGVEPPEWATADGGRVVDPPPGYKFETKVLSEPRQTSVVP